MLWLCFVVSRIAVDMLSIAGSPCNETGTANQTTGRLVVSTGEWGGGGRWREWGEGIFFCRADFFFRRGFVCSGSSSAPSVSSGGGGIANFHGDFGWFFFSTAAYASTYAVRGVFFGVCLLLW